MYGAVAAVDTSVLTAERRPLRRPRRLH